MSPTDVTTGTALALKEWGAVAHALLDGRQTLLLRKGGIHEKAFTVDGGGDGFVLFPTVAHSHAERVRPEHADLLPRGEADVADDAVIVRCGLVITAAVPVLHPERLPEVADLHIWTDRSVQEDRVDFRPRHDLMALIVRAIALPHPVRVTRTAEHGGCRSWVDVAVDWGGRRGRAVHGDERLHADARRIRATLG